MRVSLIMLSLLFAIAVNGRQAVIDSLEQRLKQFQEEQLAENAPAQIDILLQLGKLYEYRDPNLSLSYGKEALWLAQGIHDSQREAKACNNIGYGWFLLAQYDSAAICFNQSLQIFHKIDDDIGLTTSLNGLNLVHRELGELDTALEYGNQALITALRTDDDQTLATVYNSLANLYREQSNYDKALEYYQLALELTQGENKSRYAGTLMNISMVKKIQGENKEALEYAQQSLEAMRESGDSLGVASIYETIGLIYQNIGYNEKAITYLRKAEALELDSGRRNQLAGIIFNMGNSYLDLGLNDKAFENYFQALKIIENTGNAAHKALLYSKLGQLYGDLGQPDQAFDYYEQTLELHRETGDKSGIAHVYSNTAQLHSHLGNYEKALEDYRQSYEIRKEIGDKIGAAWSLLNTGVTYYYLNDLEKTLQFNQEAAGIFQEKNDKRGLATALHNIGDCQVQLKNYPAARENLEQSLGISREIKYRGLVLANYNLLADLLTRENDFQQALEYFRQAAILKDSLFTESSRKNLMDLHLQYETEKKDRENQELQFRITRQKLHQTRLYMLIGAVLILALFFIYRYYTKQKHNRILKIRIQEALKKQKEQQQIIVHQASLTSLGELAAGIAHEINQPLQSIYLTTESIELENREENPDKEYLSSMIREIYQDVERIRKIIEHIRVFSSGQKDEIREEFNINDSIRAAFSLLKQQFSQHSINVDFDLSEDLSTVLGNPYKFEQVMVNLLNNARDSLDDKAEISREEFDKNVRVRTYEKESLIITEVTDNGMGIPEDIRTSIFLPFFTTKELKRGTGLGLSISLGIIKDMQGTITVDSKHLQGACFTIRIPLKNDI